MLEKSLLSCAQVHRFSIPHHFPEDAPVHPFACGEYGDEAGQAGADRADSVGRVGVPTFRYLV